MDGVLADFAATYYDIAARLFGPAAAPAADDPDVEPAERASAEISESRDSRRRDDAVWAAIRDTPDFWVTLNPMHPDAVRRIHEMMLRHPWEVFFITQRPATAGDTVQRQTQRWLVQQGFDLPSVLVIAGSRGAAAGALRLDYHVDDSPQNCLDVKADSTAKPLLIVNDDPRTSTSARNLGIGTARSIGEALDVLDRATIERANPRLLARIASKVGWR